MADNLELQLVRAYRRYLEHLAGQHNQKSHANRFGSTDAIRANVKRLGKDKEALKRMAKRARGDKLSTPPQPEYRKTSGDDFLDKSRFDTVSDNIVSNKKSLELMVKNRDKKTPENSKEWDDAEKQLASDIKQDAANLQAMSKWYSPTSRQAGKLVDLDDNKNSPLAALAKAKKDELTPEQRKQADEAFFRIATGLNVWTNRIRNPNWKAANQ